jgi:hypothetical protein
MIGDECFDEWGEVGIIDELRGQLGFWYEYRLEPTFLKAIPDPTTASVPPISSGTPIGIEWISRIYAAEWCRALNQCCLNNRVYKNTVRVWLL